MKKLYSLILVAVILAACVGCRTQSHEHSFGEWVTKTPAACESAEVEVRKCECGEEETREGDPATGHTFTSITAESKLEKPMAGMTVTASDINVTAACACGENVTITDGISIENETLALGKNTIKVTYGELSTTLNIDAEKLDIVLDGTITDDAHISSGSKDKENSSKKEMGTKVDEFRAYLRISIKEIIDTDLFTANKNNAKVQMVLSIAGGSTTDKTTFKLRTFAPAAGVTDVDFSKLTWNSVDKNGTYSGLNWGNGTVLVDTGVGHNVSVGNDQITITLAYSQIADFVDENGNIVFAFATNTDGLKIGSLENKSEANRPTVKIILNDEHFHVFDQKVAESKYFVSAKCKQKAKYYASCACGAAGTETFSHGGVIGHNYGKLIPEQAKTCTTDGVKEHYQCSRCGKYFLDRDGKMKLVQKEDLKLSAGHDYKLIKATDATCTSDGNYKYYKCGECGLYFDADKNETTKEAQKIEKLPHSYSELVEQVDATCTTDGMNAHYRCTVCDKYFDTDKVATSAESLKISAHHDLKVIGAKEASCTEAGNNKYYQCRICGKYFTDKEGTVETTKEAQKIDKLPHSYSELVEQVDATCTTDGMNAHYRCTVCDKYFDTDKVATSAESLKISAHHDLKVIGAKEASCTEAGNNKYYQCRVCSKYFTDKEGTQETTKEEQKIPALGHTYGDLIRQVNANCTTDGMAAHYYCSVCNTYFDENKNKTTEAALKIPAAHKENVVNKQSEATCTKDGWSVSIHKCTVCQANFIIEDGKQVVITDKAPYKLIKLGHNYDPETGKCTRCGESES